MLLLAAVQQQSHEVSTMQCMFDVVTKSIPGIGHFHKSEIQLLMNSLSLKWNTEYQSYFHRPVTYKIKLSPAFSCGICQPILNINLKSKYSHVFSC